MSRGVGYRSRSLMIASAAGTTTLNLILSIGIFNCLSRLNIGVVEYRKAEFRNIIDRSIWKFKPK